MGTQTSETIAHIAEQHREIVARLAEATYESLMQESRRRPWQSLVKLVKTGKPRRAHWRLPVAAGGHGTINGILPSYYAVEHNSLTLRSQLNPLPKIYSVKPPRRSKLLYQDTAVVSE